MTTTPIHITLSIESKDGTALVLCQGKLIAGAGDLLYLPVLALMSDHKHIILDLAGLTQMDSMGIGTLVRVYVSAKSRGCTLELRNLGKKVREVLSITKLLPVFSVVGEHRMWM